MTRLRQDERRVLDTLVDAGVARSRSDALAWCVTLVGEHTDEWLASLRRSMTSTSESRRSLVLLGLRNLLRSRCKVLPSDGSGSA